MDEDPWSFPFRRFFLRPVFVVLCNFLEKEIVLARPMLHKLRTLQGVLAASVENAYGTAATQFVETDEGLPVFARKAAAVDAAARAKTPWPVLQNKHDIVDLYVNS